MCSSWKIYLKLENVFFLLHRTFVNKGSLPLVPNSSRAQASVTSWITVLCSVSGLEWWQGGLHVNECWLGCRLLSMSVGQRWPLTLLSHRGGIHEGESVTLEWWCCSERILWVLWDRFHVTFTVDWVYLWTVTVPLILWQCIFSILVFNATESAFIILLILHTLLLPTLPICNPSTNSSPSVHAARWARVAPLSVCRW